jgi:hypothetical protein
MASKSTPLRTRIAPAFITLPHLFGAQNNACGAAGF